MELNLTWDEIYRLPVLMPVGDQVVHQITIIFTFFVYL